MSSIVNRLFQGLIFQKQLCRENYCVYVAKIYSNFADGNKRFIFVFVPFQFATQESGKIDDLNWKNIQTRTLKDENKEYGNFKYQKWTIPRYIEDLEFTLINRSDFETKYQSTLGLPLEMILLHKTKGKFQYYNKVTLSAALETFQCSITNFEI